MSADLATAKKSINAFVQHCNAKIAEAEGFILGYQTDGITTPAAKRQAHKIVGNLNDQFDRLKTRWNGVNVAFSQNLEETTRSALEELEVKFEDVRKRKEDAEEKVSTLLDNAPAAPGGAVGGAAAFNASVPPPMPPQRPPPKLDVSWRPPILSSEATITELNSWMETFDAHVDANKEYITACTNNMKKTFMTSLWDAKLNAAFKADTTMKNVFIIRNQPEAGDAPSLSKWLKKHILRFQPLYVLRYKYSQIKQVSGESFAQFWTRKVIASQEADLENITPEAVAITEVITSVNDEKLRNEFLKLQNPTLQKLLDIGHQFDHQKAINRQNFSKEVSFNKVQSDYKKSQKKDWSENRGQSQRLGKFDRCKLCGSNRSCKNGVCMNKNHECSACGKKGHLRFAEFCPKKDPKAKKATEAASSSEDEEEDHVRTNTVKAMTIKSKKTQSSVDHDDCRQTPVCSMTIQTRASSRGRGHQFNHMVLPDTGCSQSIVAFDVAKENGMEINKSKRKRILNASDEIMHCNGSVTFNVKYCGLSTMVEALVSSDLENEVLLGWQTLKRLSIIPEDFPRPILPNKACSVQPLPESGAQHLCQNSFISEVDEKSKPVHQVQHHQLVKPRHDQHGVYLETDIKQSGPKCLKTFSSKNLYLSDDTKANVKEAMEAFPNVFMEPCEDNVLKIMKGDPMVIQIKPGPKVPMHIYAARKTPFAFQGMAKKELESLAAMGIIEPCGSEASIWCSPCSFVRKPNGGVRTVVDLQGLNKHVMRPTHPFPTGKEILANIPKDSKVFAVFDCLKGYWQIELAEESKPYTTFLTEFGRFRYLRAPMGLNASGDEFCLRTDRAIADLQGTKKLVDDILLFAPSHEVLLERIIALFKRCQTHGITLSKSKFQYGEEVRFSGYIVNAKGYKPDPAKLTAIRDFPAPTNLTNMRSFFGLTNQIAAFSPDLKHALAPMQPLLKPKNKFQWLAEHQAAFEAVKFVLTNEDGPLLRHFDPNLPVTLTTDASRTGLGFLLTQTNKEGNTGLIQCGSRFLSRAEGNYAVVEIEAIAVQWAIIKCRHYLLGTDFKVLTDHKPLVGVMNGRDIDSLSNARLQRICSKLIGYQFEVCYLPGKINFVADCLSRSPVFQPEVDDQKDVLVQTLKIKALDPKLEVIIEAAANDNSYQEVVEALSVTKNCRDLHRDHPGRKFMRVWNQLAYEKNVGLLTVNDRIVVPKGAQKAVLDDLHIAHAGEVKTYFNARQLYFWPNMRRDVVNLVTCCQDCVSHLPSKPKTPIQQTTASRPFEAVSVDLAQYKGQHYLVVVDRYSGWINAARLTNLETSAVIRIMTDWHCDYGWPQFLRSDGGSQFRTEFTAWCETNGVKHEKSSPENHKSNGHAEQAVKTVKKLLAKVDGNWSNFRKALHEWRNTPRASDGLSPAQWATGHRQRSGLPALPPAFDRISDQDLSLALDRRGMAEMKTKSDFDQFKKPDAVIPNGTRVVVQSKPNAQGKPGRWDQFGTIVSKRPHTDIGQSYIVDIDGHERIRSHLYLRPATDTISETVTSVEEPEVNPPLLRSYAEVAGSKEKIPPRRSNRKDIPKPHRYRM